MLKNKKIYYGLMVVAVAVLASLWFVDAAQARICPYQPCPEGQSLDENCNCSGPLPEMEVMMVPVAMGIAGLFAVRARRRAMKGKDNDNGNVK